MELTTNQFERARQALLGPGAEEIIEMIFGLVMQGRPGNDDKTAEAILRELEVADGDPLRLTRLGYLVADSIREYVFWRERDRRLPCEGTVQHLSAGYFAGKSLLEVGCGMGSNLMSLSGLEGRFVGVEPVAVYRQMSGIFCEKEHLLPIEIRPGSGETLPFADSVYDVVLCISSHQYMDVRKALAEMTRVLAPGGELIIVGGTLDTYLLEGLRPVARGSLRGLKDFTVTVVNTIAYSAVGRRLVGSNARGTTAFPIYPLKSRMTRWLSDCGLVEHRRVERTYPESCFSYVKPTRTT